jgi:3'-phosphoadenosine 5'-phosphosulfate sulfotransferase (PAPS reductase)/FAD synthetase
MNPYKIEGPATVSFSGGATSGYMLSRIVDAHGGRLPPDVVVLFQNTGREMPATLDFVRDCGMHFGVSIVWLEYAQSTAGPTYRVVTHETASREGEPFEALLNSKKTLPNPVARFCTIELKIRTAKRYILATYGWKRWRNIVGLRADEPRRVARATDPARNKKDRWDVVCPLAEAGVTAEDVAAFWAAMPFRLNLAGKWEGNCDGCFLKGKMSLLRMAHDYPERMAWWAKQEAVARGDGAGKVFRIDRPSYAALIRHAAMGPPPVQSRIDFDALMDADPECGNSCDPVSEPRRRSKPAAP